jgi:hypothetical protein
LEVDLIAGIHYLRLFPRSMASFAARILIEIRAMNPRPKLTCQPNYDSGKRNETERGGNK